MNVIPTIGLEVHLQLGTQTKLFCGCRAEYGAPPNSRTCPVCLGLPGALPVINAAAVRLAIRMILALGGRVALVSSFDRKNYFYADIPKNYQITQYATPIGSAGAVTFDSDGAPQTIGITRMHLEEDAGKLTHPDRCDYSLVDLNRAGIPLLEIVSEPTIVSSQQAHAYLSNLKQIARALRVSDCDMEKGQLRCDVNLSVRQPDTDVLGPRVEVKNLNSFRNVQRAINFEIGRQAEQLDRNESVVQETRLFDPATGATQRMRAKEQADEYRYFPEPDLGPLAVPTAWIAEANASLPELPATRRKRFVADLGLSQYAATLLTAEGESADYFERCLAVGGDPVPTANWIMTELLRECNARGGSVESLGVEPRAFVELIALVEQGIINAHTGKAVLSTMFQTGHSAEKIVAEQELAQVSDDASLRASIETALRAHPNAEVDYRAGKKTIIGFLVGQVMRETNGKANPKAVTALLGSILNKRLEG